MKKQRLKKFLYGTLATTKEGAQPPTQEELARYLRRNRPTRFPDSKPDWAKWTAIPRIVGDIGGLPDDGNVPDYYGQTDGRKSPSYY